MKANNFLRTACYWRRKGCETSCRDPCSSRAQSFAVSALTGASSLSIHTLLSYLIFCTPQQIDSYVSFFSVMLFVSVLRRYRPVTLDLKDQA